MIQRFSRIQIACADLSQAVQDYQTLFDAPPFWQGRVTDPVRYQQIPVAAAWFDLDNVVIELLDASALKIRPGICGLVFYTSQEPSLSLTTKTSDCFYKSNTAQSFEETLHYLPDEKTRGLSLAVTTKSHLPAVTDENHRLRVDHVVLRSSSAESCIKLFGDELGIRLALDQNKPEWGGRMLFFRTGKLTLEIIAPEDGLKAGDYFWGLAFQVADIDKQAEKFSAGGVDVSEVRDGRKPGTRVATLKSHDLNVATLIIEPVKI